MRDSTGVYILIVFVILALSVAVFAVGKGGRIETKARIYLDEGTGCQYLSTRKHQTLTPRYDAEGNHLCKKSPPIKED